MAFDKLTALLRDVPDGPILDKTLSTRIIDLVETDWSEFAGATDTKMESRKVTREDGPMDLTWRAPILSFVILRHGAAAFGSSRAEKQCWNLDLSNGTATPQSVGFRQLRPRSAVLDVEPIAKAVCDAVEEGQKSTSDLLNRGVVLWKSDCQVVVKHGLLIPNEGPKKTVAGRRKRFRSSLIAKMDAAGWDLHNLGQAISFNKRQ